MSNYIKGNYKNWAIFFIVALSFKLVSLNVNSDFIDEFLTENLVLLLPALLAINVTTISILLTKIIDFRKRFPSVSFRETICAMKHSITEQIILIVLATILLILKEGEAPTLFSTPAGQNVLSVLLIMFAIAAIQIVLDTANSLFDFLSTEDET